MHRSPLARRRPHVARHCVELDGVSTYIRVDDLAPHLYGGPLSYSIWAKINASASLQMLLGLNEADGTNIFLLRVQAGVAYVDIYGSVSPLAGTRHTTTTVAGSGDWHHVAVTWDRGNTNVVKLYIDGALEFTSSAYSATLADDDRWTIGGELDGASMGDILDGRVCQAAFYGRELSAADVAAAYNGGWPLDERGLGPCSLYVPGDHGQDDLPAVPDIGPIAAHGTAVGLSSGDFYADAP